MFKITKAAWLNSGKVCVVEVFDEIIEKEKYYIKGFGTNASETKDLIETAKYGNSINKQIGQLILLTYGFKKDIEYDL